MHDHLDYGIIGWNDSAATGARTHFSNMKESGLCHEGGVESIELYLETKYPSIGNL